MIAAALSIGVPLALFWSLTPRELALHHRGALQRRRVEMARILQAEHLRRAERLPTLDELTGAPAQPRYAGTARDFMRWLTHGMKVNRVGKAANEGQGHA